MVVHIRNLDAGLDPSGVDAENFHSPASSAAWRQHARTAVFVFLHHQVSHNPIGVGFVDICMLAIDADTVASVIGHVVPNQRHGWNLARARYGRSKLLSVRRLLLLLLLDALCLGRLLRLDLLLDLLLPLLRCLRRLCLCGCLKTLVPLAEQIHSRGDSLRSCSSVHGDVVRVSAIR